MMDTYHTSFTQAITKYTRIVAPKELEVLGSKSRLPEMQRKNGAGILARPLRFPTFFD
jgi:hypothetical protein